MQLLVIFLFDNLVDPGFTCLNLQQLNLINVMGEITSDIKVKYNTRLSSREPLYSFSAVIAGWLQSSRHKIVHMAVKNGNLFVNILLLIIFFADYRHLYIRLCICITRFM